MKLIIYSLKVEIFYRWEGKGWMLLHKERLDEQIKHVYLKITGLKFFLSNICTSTKFCLIMRRKYIKY